MYILKLHYGKVGIDEDNGDLVVAVSESRKSIDPVIKEWHDIRKKVKNGHYDSKKLEEELKSFIQKYSIKKPLAGAEAYDDNLIDVHTLEHFFWSCDLYVSTVKWL